MKTLALTSSAFLLLLGLTGCGDDKGADTGDETGTGDETATDDDVGESGTGSSTTDDGESSTDDAESTTEGTTTDDEGCPIGSEGCPCTDGNGCDPGLTCEGGTCESPADTGDTTGDTGDTTGDTGDTTDTTDTGGEDLYQACPDGDDDCAQGEICVQGQNMLGGWSMCTSGTCMGDDDCAVSDDDFCADLPGDGEPIDYCVPFACDQNDPCPDPMVCAPSFNPNDPSVCVWPNN